MIAVNRPLDYERVPGGMISLTLMAIDGGTPALNSTVPVTVELFVSRLDSRPYVPLSSEAEGCVCVYPPVK